MVHITPDLEGREREEEGEREDDPDFVEYRRTDMAKAAPDSGNPLDDLDHVEYERIDMEKAVGDIWNSFDEARKQMFLTVHPSDLATFCRDIVQQPWLVGFLSDAIAFFELHSTWEMYLCPDQDCLRLFQDDESLITHLKCEHFPMIDPVAWQLRRRNLAEERWCADALRKMVWKPIVVETALDLLSATCLDDPHGTLACEFAGSDWLYSFNWPYSDDPERKRLLVELEKEFQVLLAEHHQVSFSLLSDGYFSKMTALASKHIFDGRPPRFNTYLVQNLFASSPLSFCLLKAADLSRFLEIVKTMSQFVERHKLPYENQVLSDYVEDDVSWNKSEILDAISFSSKESLFRFCKAEPLCSDDRVSILSLLCNGACIPKIPRVPSKAKESFSCVLKILNELRECQTGPGSTHQINLTQPCRNCCFMGESCNRSWTINSLWGSFSFGDLVKADSIVSHFQTELNCLQLVNRVLCLESQLRKLCALDCRMYILPLMKSFLRLDLYFHYRRHLHKMREENPAAQLPMIPYLEDHTEKQVSCEESESECDSDSDLYLDDMPWRPNTILHTLASATGKTEGSGPFFWVAISDVLRHCEEDRHGVDKSVQEGIRWFILNKTWKYWLCYTCGSKFIDRESHMVHLENKHELCIPYDEYWLTPQQDSGDEGWEFKQVVVKRKSDLVDSITLDCNSPDYFLVDSTEFCEMPSAKDKFLGRANCKGYQKTVHSLENKLSHLRYLFEMKREILMYLEVLNALDLMLFDGSQHLSLLASWLSNPAPPLCISNLSCYSMDANFLRHRLFRFFSLLNQANVQGCGPSSNFSVEEASKDMKLVLILIDELCLFMKDIFSGQLLFRFRTQLLNLADAQGCRPLRNYALEEALKEMKHDLIAKLNSKDLEILRAVDRINRMKRCLSDLCVCDYRTEFVPPVRSFLHAKFKFNNNLRSLECNNVKEFLSNLDQLLVEDRVYSFKVEVLSPGKVIINAMENNSSWKFAFVGIHLKFVGEFHGVALAGSFNFGWWSNLGICGNSGSVTPEDSAVISDWGIIHYILCQTLSSKLLSLVRKHR